MRKRWMKTLSILSVLSMLLVYAPMAAQVDINTTSENVTISIDTTTPDDATEPEEIIESEEVPTYTPTHGVEFLNPGILSVTGVKLISVEDGTNF